MDATTLTCHFAPVFPYRPELKRKRPQVPQGPRGFPNKEDDWIVEFESFDSADRKVQIFGHLFRPEKVDPQLAHRAVVILHGQGEHSGRYIHWAHYLKNEVGSIYLIDHRGHGQSTGIRGHVDKFDCYADDAAAAVRRYHNYLMEKYGKAEIHVVGHSMGGLIALRAALLYNMPIRSLTVSAPMIELGFPVGRVKEFAAGLLNKLVPYLPLPSEPLGDLISRDPAVVEHYKSDSLNHGLASPGFYFSYLAAKNDTLRRAKEFRVPLLVLLPMADQVINPEGTEELYRALQAPEKKIIRYPGLYHEVFNEPEKDRVFADLKAWLRAHYEGATPGS
ncbi:MAG TPA: alpha/beta hydrolase [Oligoflexus sp.]|uniref:alpha/beta hydrolase n=1 Tax=Oligoflexus sp. TaxID=1971216 RepID=UPI002D4082EF|nr:lysophospholipase [Oligoflexus sp.]HYX35905.1 alpha/beta hydrolase [Oligoflexus sp.]